MAFTGNYSCNTLRTGLLDGTIDFGADTFYLALYTNTATLNASTTAYTATGEASGGDYVAGGQVVTASVASDGTTAYVNFSSPSWSGAITARGALIYKPGDNGAVCVLDFGSDKTSTVSFNVQMPANTATSALLRLT